jgi:sec-independent protein translocase protein TatB
LIDLGISKLALIGAVALVVIGPEKLPRVARTMGTLLGKAQRYIANVKDEVNRAMDLDELKKMRDSMEGAVRDVEQTIQTQASAFESDITSLDTPANEPVFPEYKHPDKNWRLKRGATPQWYKSRNGVRTRALSGAARVARYRPVRTR